MIILSIILLIAISYVPILILCILDSKLNLKTRLIKLFKTTKRYETTIFIISITSIILFWYVSFIKNRIDFLGFTLIFLFHYLLRIPEELR